MTVSILDANYLLPNLLKAPWRFEKARSLRLDLEDEFKSQDSTAVENTMDTQHPALTNLQVRAKEEEAKLAEIRALQCFARFTAHFKASCLPLLSSTLLTSVHSIIIDSMPNLEILKVSEFDFLRKKPREIESPKNYKN